MTAGDAPFVHPKALCEAQVGPGTRVWAFAHVMDGAIVGAGCNVGDHAFVESGARIGDRVTIKNGVSVWDGVTVADDAFLGPNAAFTNDLFPRGASSRGGDEFVPVPTRIGRGASIGANATVVCGITVGAYALVGAGAVVVADVPAHALVVGNPARAIGWACRCGHRLPDALTCGECGTSYSERADGTGLHADD